MFFKDPTISKQKQFTYLIPKVQEKPILKKILKKK